MLRRFGWMAVLIGIAVTVFALSTTVQAATTTTIVCPTGASFAEKLAAKEIRRYFYLRTGRLAEIATAKRPGDLVVVTTKDSPADRDLVAVLGDILIQKKTTISGLSKEQYVIKSAERKDGGRVVLIIGGDPIGTLYGAYRFAEHLGVRFYLHGDTVPDEQIPPELPKLDEVGKPLFALRGIQPFHDFPEGPDWWNTDDYLAYVSQLAKMRMNFIGMHCYPQGGGGPEALVWIGAPNDIGAKGQVTFSYPAYWKNTAFQDAFNYAPMKTSEFSGGAALLFPSDDYGPDVMADLMPLPRTTAQCNELFNRVGKQMNRVFAAAKQVGVKTCVGTETPLTIPTKLRQHLAGAKDARTIYTGIFKRIAEACPVDYYWLWTPEGWTWSGNNPTQLEATTRDIQAALDALKDLGNPFTLATCGWVLGPAQDRAALDEFLPKSSPMSCINRIVGHDGVEPAFSNVIGRPKWAIPWMENDPEMVQPQPWAARMRYDAVDARRFGCTGLLGIHWRVKAMAFNVAALAAAAWDQSWVPPGFDTTPVKPSKGGEGAVGGSVARFTAPVAGTTEQAVYQTVRYGLTGYNLSIPDGIYTVKLQFNEPHYAAAGKRVFGAKIQSKQVLEHLDIFAKVGQNRAIDLSYPNFAVNNGTLRIDFTQEVEHPCIAGIVITGKTKATNQLASERFTRKINCGGDKVADYEADRMSGGTAPAAPRDRAMPIEDFYIDFARANFGAAVAEPAGKVLAKIDGIHLPEITGWQNGPGNLVVNGRPWSEVQKRFAFVDELAALRQQIQGAGNLQRFDYWLNTYRAMSAMSEVACARGKLDKAMNAKNYDEALAARVELGKLWTRLLALQTSIVSTPGEMGTIANLEQHTRRFSHFVDGHDAALATALGKALPPEVQPGKDYAGPATIIVPAVRSSVRQGESLTVKLIVLDKHPVSDIVIHVRALGRGDWQAVPAAHVARAVYTAQLPAAVDDFEYYVTAGSQNLAWPATAPQLNQTVVVTQP
jgi:hypothetical protein